MNTPSSFVSQRHGYLIRVAQLLGVALVVACGESPTDQPGGDDAPGITCSIDIQQVLIAAGARDAVPALTDPVLVSVGALDAEYLRDGSRVVGVRVGATFFAVPHNILWWHEIVNFNFAGLQLAVTFCPLTGSSLVFDRGSVGGAELGVSGLLFQNNLMMYDRRDESSLFPQMMRQGACGPKTGQVLTPYPAVEMTWAAWKSLHPETLVLSGETGFARDYTRYPYGGYESLADSTTLYPMDPLDTRRPPKERVLGIPDRAGGGIAFPYGELSEAGDPLRAVQLTLDGVPIVILWDEQAQAATAFLRTLDGQALDLAVQDGHFVDLQTGSAWTIDGLASEGPLQGMRLTPVTSAYVSFWFAWAAFQPQAETWTQGP